MTAQLAMRRSDGRLTRATDTTAHHASCVKTVKRIVDKLLSPNSVVILVFSELIAVYKFKTLTEALNTGGGDIKILHLSANNSLYLVNGAKQKYGYCFQWTTIGKSYVFYRTTWHPMTLTDREGHFRHSKPF